MSTANWKSVVVVAATLFASASLYAADIEISCDMFRLPALANAIQQANGSGESIGLTSGCEYAFASAPDDDYDAALPVITGNVRIEGRGATISRVASATTGFRFFWVSAGGSLTLTNLTLEGGLAPKGLAGSNAAWNSSAGNGGDGQDGGAIVNHGTVVLDRALLVDNEAGQGGAGGDCLSFGDRGGGSGGRGGRGGAIWNNGILTVRNLSVLRGNAAGEGGEAECSEINTNLRGGDGGHGGGGGAIWSEPQSSTTIMHSTLTYNAAGPSDRNGDGSDLAGGDGGDGGAIASFGALTVEDSTVEYNAAGRAGSSRDTFGGDGGRGGGISAGGGTFAIRRSTIFKNRGGEGGQGYSFSYGRPGAGGAIYAAVTGVIENATIAGNIANQSGCGLGGNGGALDVNAGAVVDVRNATIINNLPGNANCEGAVPAGTIGGIVSRGEVRLHNTLLEAGTWTPNDASPQNPYLCSGNVIDSTPGFNHYWSPLSSGGTACPDTLLSRAPALHGVLDSPATGRDPADGPQPARLSPGSKALNAGDNATCLSTDQLGTARPQGANCDVGAFEAPPPRFFSHPQTQTVSEIGSATLSVTIDNHGLGAPDVKWQFSSDGLNWVDLTTPAPAIPIGHPHHTSAYEIADVERSHGGHYRAFATNVVSPEGVASNSAELTIQWGPVITLNLPVSITANIGEEFVLALNYEAWPPVQTVHWEISKDGSTWQYLANPFAGSTGQDFYFPYVATAEMFNASTPWRYRVRLTGGYPDRPDVTSNVAVVTVTDDPTIPRFVGGFVHGMPWPEGTYSGVYILVAGNPPPAIAWQSSIDGGDTWNTLPRSGTEWSYNTSPTEYSDGRAQLNVLPKGFKDGWKFRAVLNGHVYSDPIDLRITVETSMEIDCPQFVLPDEVYSCTATVIPQPQFGPRERLPSGYVSWTGAPASVSPGLCSRPCCKLDERGQCTLSFLNDQASGGSISIEASYPFFETGLPAHLRDRDSQFEVQITVAACAEPIVTDAPTAFQLETESGECFGIMPDLTSQIVAPERGCPVTIEQTPAAGTEMSLGTHSVVFNVTSDAGSDVWNLSLTVVDASTPVITISGDNPATLACGETWDDPGATITTACGTSVPTFADGSVDPSTPGRYTVTYGSTDPVHAGITATRQVDVVDDQPPSIALLGGAELIVECLGVYVDEGATATDSCSGPVEPVLTILKNGEPVGSADAPGVYTFRYTASDAVGNQASVNRTVTIADDAGPVFAPIGTTLLFECNTTPLFPARSAVDACEGEIAAVLVGNDVNTTTVGWYSAFYRATDSSGNATDQTQPVFVTDTGNPVITLSGDAEMTIECGTAYAEPGVLVTDSCDPAAALYVDGAVDSNTPGSYTLSYFAYDAIGNFAESTRTVHVVDSINPVVTLAGDGSVTIECHATFDDPGATAVDACAGPLAITTSGNVDLDVPGTYTRRYAAADPSGNVSFAERTIIVKDTTKPVITLAGLSAMTVECQDAFDDPGATASDACDASLDVVVTGTVDPTTPGTYTLKYNTTDDAGLAADEVTRTVIVFDTTGPVIDLAGDTLITVECHTSFSDPGASSLDACDGTRTVTVTGSVDVDVPATYTLRYNATDNSGNAAAEVTRTVIVSDTTAPVITLGGEATMTVECSASFTDPSATASDSCDSAVAVTVTGSVDVDTPGSYTLQYEATDDAGNAAATVTRTVIVVDTTRPVITIEGANPMAVESQTSFTDPGATAVDACAGTFAAVASGPVDLATVGSYTISYDATDPAGNAAVQVTRTVNVIDTTDPAFASCAPPLAVFASASCATLVPDFTSQAVVSDTTSPVQLSQLPAAGTSVGPGVHTITITARDASGNESTCTTTFTVADNVSPVLSCPADVSVDALTDRCERVVRYDATATDTCGAVTLNYSHASGSSFGVGLTEVTVTATDAAGNQSSCTFNVDVDRAASTTVISPATAQYSDPMTITTTVTVGDDPLSRGAVSFALDGVDVGSAGIEDGVASLTLPPATLPSTPTITATFAGDECVARSSTRSVATIAKEDATLTYTGPTAFAASESSTSVSLAALVTQADDGSPGDLTKAAVFFHVYRNRNSNPEVSVPATVDASGVATATATIPRGGWIVIVSFDDELSWFDGADAEARVTIGNSKRRAVRK